MSEQREYAVVAFDLGRSLQREISQRAAEFYKYLASAVGGVFDCAMREGKFQRETIPVPWSSVQREQPFSQDSVLQARLDALVTPDMLIVDLAHSHHQGGLLQSERDVNELIVWLVSRFFDMQRDQSSLPIVAIISEELEDDFTYSLREIRKHYLHGHIVSFNIYGDFAAGTSALKMHSKEAPTEALRNAINSDRPAFSRTWMPKAFLKRHISEKIVKVPGLYRLTRADQTEHFVNGYYDASFCAEEVSRYIGDYIGTRINCQKHVDIYYHYESSAWFKINIIPLISARLNQIFAGRLSYRETDMIDHTREGIGGQFADSKDNALLITPFVGTGRTIRRIIEFYRSSGAPGPLHVLAVMQSSEFDKSSIPSGPIIPNPTSQISYEAMLVLDDGRRTGTGDFVGEFGHSRRLTTNHSESYRIPGDKFWLMCLESGLTYERHKPDNRRPIGCTPDYIKMISIYRAYMNLLIRTAIRPTSIATVLICVDEEQEGDDAATMFCDSFRAITGDSYIKIPRSVLNGSLDNSSYSRICLEYGGEKWYKQLSGLRELPGVAGVLFDEFRYSGHTMTQLKRLVKMFDVPVHHSFCVVDYHPTARAPVDKAFYEIDLARAW